MDVSIDLLINALVAGLLLGGFYAAVTIGVSISFGILDIVNIAHPAFIILGSYIAYMLNTRLGIDPIVAWPSASRRFRGWPSAALSSPAA
jgi:branched-chain amino acid transport system permease protein